MGQGSRGGNSGLTSSGGRKREDKELSKAKTEARKAKSPAAEAKKAENKKSGGGKGLSLPRARGLRGLRGLSGLARLAKLSSKGSAAKTASKSASNKMVKPQAIKPQNKIPTITRTNTPKVKLTKQRSNKAPN